jgi:small subunit ribosomal protein S9
MVYEKNFFCGTGRRKSAVARVRLYAGSGSFRVNNVDVSEYFSAKALLANARRPFDVLENGKQFDVICDVYGGGISGQAGAVCHGLSSALVKFDNDSFRPTLKKAGLLTRDSRVKERKKYGLKAARRRPQFSKR